MWLSIPILCPIIKLFIFRVLGFPYTVVTSGLVLCTRHIALQEHQAVALMLHKIAFKLFSKVVALHLDNSIAKDYEIKWYSISFSF